LLERMRRLRGCLRRCIIGRAPLSVTFGGERLAMSASRRKLIFLLSACVVLLVAIVAFMQWSAGRSFEERHVRWLQQQRPAYEQMAGKIMAQKTTLTSQPRDLGDIVPRPFTASGRTNADGSVTIIFSGGEGGPRHGYLYHSGALLTRNPGDPDAFFCHITNGWYEY
jgi:hypothetical protein